MAKISKTSVPVSVQRSKSPLTAFHDEFDNMISNFYNMTGFPRLRFPINNSENFENLMLNPSIDIVDDKENLKIEAEMPGMGEENIKVSITDGMLTIRGEKETSRKDEGKNYVRREIGYGSYERTIPLPDSVDVEKAKASFKKGMLWVIIPKKPESAKRARELKVEKAEK